MNTCLDSWAVISWLQGREPAASRVEKALDERPLMNWINVGEVYYVIHRSDGRQRAEKVIRHIRGQLHLDEATPERTLEAARIKAAFPMAYADAFALATAAAHGARLLTGDPEILAASGPWQIEDLR